MALACVAFGCSAKPTGDAAPPDVISRVADPTNAAEVKPAIVGTLRAADGSLLRAAEIIVRRDGFAEPVTTRSLDANGSFRIELEPGLYMISVGAVDHAQIVRWVLLDDELRVTGNLGTYARSNPGDTLPIIGQFLDAANKRLGPAPSTATRMEDGVYRIDLSQPPNGAKRMRYQLRVGGGRTANGPVADAYESDGGGDYWSVVELGDRKELLLEIGALPSPGQDAALVWEGEDETVVALRHTTSEWERDLRKLVASFPQHDNNVFSPTDDDEARVVRLVDQAREQADATKDTELRTLLRAAHLMQFAAHMKVERAREELTWFIEHISVDERRLLLLRGLEGAFFYAMQDADLDFVMRAEAWLERFAAECREPGPAIVALNLLLYFADRRGDEARVETLYARASEPPFLGTHQYQRIAHQYDPARTLKRGKPLPDFDFAMLGDPSKRVTKGEREGRLFLLEFWATWCGPCVAEMPVLHETYAAINGARRGGKGEPGLRRLKPAREPKVEFVFVSFDSTEKDVVEFRRKHWSMPWTHAFVGQGIRDNDVMKRFGFSGVPTTILVDGNGTILEYGDAVRREKLKTTLERVLAARP